MTAIPSQRDFQRIMTCEIGYVREFLAKFKGDCWDLENKGSPEHWAALNPNLQILYSFSSHRLGFSLHAFDKFSLSPIDIACRVINSRHIAHVFYAGLQVAGKRGNPFTIEDALAIGMQEQKNDKFCALVSAAAVSDVEFLETNFSKNQSNFCDTYLNMFRAALGSGRWGLKTIPFLLQHKDKLRARSHRCCLCTNIYPRVFDLEATAYVDALPILIETDPEFKTELYLDLYPATYTPSVETICVLHLASTDAKCVEYLKRCMIRTSKLDERCGVFAIGLIRKRITELSFALSDLPALIICEIAQAHCTMWPRARFCHYWRIVTTIKHKR